MKINLFEGVRFSFRHLRILNLFQQRTRMIEQIPLLRSIRNNSNQALIGRKPSYERNYFLSGVR